MKIPKRLQKFADENNLLVFPVTYKFQGIPIKRKGFVVCSKETFTSNGKLYRYVFLRIEPMHYSNGDKWFVSGYASGYALYFKRITQNMFEGVDFTTSFVRPA